jgi:hypothetical protein
VRLDRLSIEMPHPEMAGLATRERYLMPDERGHLHLLEIGGFVLATYREIAAHFHLSGPNAARTKAKRAGWKAEPTNHPADPLRIRVPRDAWSQAAESPPPKRSERLGDPGSHSPSAPIDTSDEMPPLTNGDGSSQSADTRYLSALEGHISTLREDVAAERAARIAVEGQRDQALNDLRLEREQRAAEAARLQAALDQGMADFRAERSRAEGAEAGRDGERSRADMLRDRLDAAEDELRKAREAADQARQHARDAEDAIEAARRVDAGRKARGRWARIRAAWRGE